MGWEGGVVVFCVVCGKYWDSLKTMISFCFQAALYWVKVGRGGKGWCDGKGFARGYAAGAAWYGKKVCVGGCGF